jgi:excisionase family DNA binding protein
VLSVKQAAERLGVSRTLVYSFVATRRLRHIRLGLGRGVIRIPPDALEEFERECLVEASEPAATPPAPTPRVRLKHLKLD